jgi:hypothetical protein
MATFTKRALSGSTNGKQILVVQTVTPGTTIHTAVTGTSDWDEIWIYAVNPTSSSAKLTLEWGEATIPTGNIECTVPGESGLQLIIPGLILQNGMIVKAFTPVSSGMMLNGFVNRIGA